MPPTNNLVPSLSRCCGTSLRPVMCSIIAAIGSLMLGTTYGYSSMAIDDLNSHPNPFRVNRDQYSWFASINLVCCVPGCLTSSHYMDKLGRKVSFISGTLPTVVGWIIIAGAQNVPMLYIGRAITGIGCGVLLPIVTVYISEISTPQIRGRLCTLQEMSLNVGVLFAYVVGSFISWMWLAIACASWACILVTAAAFVLPESPRWLLYKGRREEAVEALVWLRCVDETQLETEVKDIEESLKNVNDVMPWSNYFKPPMLKYFALSCSLFFFQQFSGISVVRMYALIIFKDAGNGLLSSNLETVIMGLLMVFGTVICMLLVDVFERRTLLTTSATIMSVSMSALGAYFKVLEIDPNFAAAYLSSWLPLVSVVSATVGYELGCGPLSQILTAEWFSTQARGRATSVGFMISTGVGFLQTKFFSDISQGLSLAGAFWVFAGGCLLEAFVAFLTVPITRNKTLESIQKDVIQRANSSKLSPKPR